MMRHQLVSSLFHAGHPKEEIARLVGISSRSVYRILAQEQPPARLRRHHSRHLVDPYLSYLARRWNEGCQTPAQLYEEVVAQGYTGPSRSLQRVLHQFGARDVTAHHQTNGDARKSPFRAVRCAHLRSGSPISDTGPEGHSFAGAKGAIRRLQLSLRSRKTLVRGSRKREGKSRLDHWKAAVRTSGVKELISCVEGLTDDAVAIANACTEAWNNGMVEGFNHKLKWLKRSSYGQAGFPLLQRRVRLASKRPQSR